MRFTIITSTLNSERFLPQALDSLARQEVEAESMVVDGGSSDGTIEVLRRYPDSRLVLAPGTNIYQAWNVGVEASSGEIVAFLNSDDRYPDGALQRVQRAFAADPALEVVTGAAMAFVDEAGGERPVAFYPGPESVLEFERIARGVPVINARFFRRSLLERVGPFDADCSLAADRDYLLRVVCAHPKACYMDALLYEYRVHPGSSTLDLRKHNAFRLADENLALAERWLRSPHGRDQELRRAILRWQRDFAVSGIAAALAAGRPREALRYFAAGWRQNPTWPASCLASVAHKLLERVRVRRRLERLVRG